MGHLGRRIGLSQDQGDSNPGGADGAVGGGILDLFANGYFERQDKIYNAPGLIPPLTGLKQRVVSSVIILIQEVMFIEHMSLLHLVHLV